jgi:intracellular sulfur oxidation DsrE/DsrF family protein
MRGIIRAAMVGLLYAFVSLAACAQDRAVYHIDDAQAQATKALRNIRNHLDTAPDTQIIVVAHAAGVDMLLEGAQDARQNPPLEYAPLVSALRSRGVRFEVCEITLKNRGLKKEQFIPEADFTPSGVVRIAQLQSREHYAYIKP